MILPLSKSFQSLKTRLECVNVVNNKAFDNSEIGNSNFNPNGNCVETKINVETCLQ